MTRIVWRALVIVVGAALVALPSACKKKQASVEDLYSARVLGQSYLQRNQLPEAEAEFKKLIELAPDDPLGYANLGLTYLQAGRFDDAEKQLRRARKLDPSGTESGLALARLYALTKRPADARSTLESLRTDSASSAHVLYALAELEAGQGDAAAMARREARLRELLDIASANLAARLNLADVLLSRGAADSTVRQLEEVRRIPPEPPREARVLLDSTIQLLRGGNVQGARPVFDRMVGVLQGTAPYQAALDEVRWTEGPIAGRPILAFAPKNFVSNGGVRAKAAVELAKFVDASDEAGLGGGGAAAGSEPRRGALAVGDVDGDGTDDLFVSTPAGPAQRSGARLYVVQGGFVRDATTRAGIVLPQGATEATFADFDNDGWLDLFALGGEGRGHLFRNSGTGTFTDATAKAGIADVKGATSSRFVDLDHDGDLDLVLAGGPKLVVYRNNLDGSFSDATAAYGLDAAGAASDVAFADFDGDGRVDLFVAIPGAHGMLFHNGGAARFSDVTAASGLAADNGSTAAVGDYDNDGHLDLITAGSSGVALWRNRGDGSFARDARSPAASLSAGATLTAASLLDYDNDGWLDIVAGGTATGGKPALFVLRNDGTGTFIDRSSVVPAAVRSAGAGAIAVSDVDDDGDEDLFLLDAMGAPRLLRNDFGNSNLAVNVELKALRTGSGKNNAFGIGARLELRAGEIYQTRVATDRVTHFGLGSHLKADVLRIEWPNGVPQTVYFPGTDADVVEREMLKGSCAFAYTWDGTRFRFVTDAMWRSALGMPLGLMGGSSATAFAPAGASQEYLRIPGDALRPRDGKYILQMTEELWETAYADEVKLIAVDRPDSIDVFVDERFVPPGPVKLRLFQIAHREYPLSAVDERGSDVLPALRASDDVYVSNLVPTKYQGVVEPHDLVLDLGPNAGDPGSNLFLRGWIYPTDASINVALGQQTEITPFTPSVEVRDAKGRWTTAIGSIGFPSGKDKTIVVDIAGKFPTSDHHVRIRTNMQIYWDEAFVARELPDNPAKMTTLAPVSADLHYRGFSRMYRKGGRYGPYWFAYDDVSRDSPWRPITGTFTRFGDVLPLLRGADDMYIVMAPGDEATIEFDAASATSLPAGWRRDFLLYTDGWIKDSDLNTAFGTTVAPLPFHGVRSYPYAKGDAYPTDSAHQRYLREYGTREVTRAATQR
jgi:Tfp pilus assembly protein PilF